MENIINFFSDLTMIGIVVSIMAMIVSLVVIIIIVMFISWLYFMFMPEFTGDGLVVEKHKRLGGNEYAGGLTIPTERFIYLNVIGFNEKIFSCLVSKKIFDLLKSGDKVKILYCQGFWGLKVVKIIE